MKIVHIYKNYYPTLGGIENHIKTLAEFQINNGFDVSVLVTAAGLRTKIESINSVKVVRAGQLGTLSSTPLSLSLWYWLRKLKADIAHLHFPYPVGEVANYLVGRSASTLITYHSDIIKQKYIYKLIKPLLFKVVAKADRIIATSPQYINSSPLLRNFKEKCEVVPLGVDISRFAEPDLKLTRNIKKEFRGEKIILFVGRLRYFKGLKYLIDAMHSIHARLLIIGTGPEEISLKQRATEQNLNAKILFLGDIADIELASYYNACDIFVLPSSHRSEAFGTVLIEAMAAGKPVISTELGTGTSFINQHDVSGLVVQPRDPAALAAAINKLLANESLRGDFGRQAKKRAQQFSQQIMNEAVVKLYNELGCITHQ